MEEITVFSAVLCLVCKGLKAFVQNNNSNTAKGSYTLHTRVVNDSGIGIRFRNQNRNQSLVCWNRNWNRNHMMLESKLDRNQGFWETLESQEVGATL